MEPRAAFNSIIEHQIKGMMFHNAAAIAFGYLGFEDLKQIQRYQYFNESISMSDVADYYICHFDRLPESSHVDFQSPVPRSWYGHSRYDVDVSTKKTGIISLFEAWREWEYKTKVRYQEIHRELLGSSECAAACVVSDLITDVDCELAKVDYMVLELKAISYDLAAVYDLQKSFKEYFMS